MRLRRIAIVAGLAATLFAAPLAAKTVLTESGSTLFYPLVATWAAAYHDANPDVTIETQPTGSGVGINEAIDGTVHIGASDAFLTDAQMQRAPLLNIALAVSAQVIGYNLPELGGASLQLSGKVLADMYLGEVKFWDDPKIGSINRDVAAKLPHKQIILVRRNDSSGDTLLFTRFLSLSSPAWKAGPGEGTHVVWPAAEKTLAAPHNRGVVEQLKVSPYAIGYVGISYLEQMKALGLGSAALQNRSGVFVKPSEDGMRAAVNALSGQVPADERLSLLDAPGETVYPIVNFEYAIVQSKQKSPNEAAELKKFLSWTLTSDGGSSTHFLAPVHFIALPDHVADRSKQMIALIK